MMILNNLKKLSFTLHHKLNLSMLISYEVIGYKMFCYVKYFKRFSLWNKSQNNISKYYHTQKSRQIVMCEVECDV